VIATREKKKFTEYLEEYEVGQKLEHIGAILSDLAQITSQLKDPDGAFFGTFGSFQKIAAKINAGEGSLGRFVTTDEFYGQVMKELDEISRLIARLREAADNVTQASLNVQQASENFDVATREAPEIADKVQELLDRLLRVSVILERAMHDVPEITTQAREGMREVNRILDSVQENFLIRPNLPPPPEPESHGLEIRGGQD
jgi:ABC-type transporter Mla subunit MlaD